MALSLNMDSILASFKEEAVEHMDSFEHALLELERDHKNTDAIHTAFRTVHTLKGSGGLFKYEELVRFAHSFENLLDVLREGKIGVTPEIIALLFKGHDHLQALLKFYAENSKELPLSELTALSNVLILRVNQLMAVNASSSTAAPKATEEASAPIAENGPNGQVVYLIDCKADLFRAGLVLEGAFRYLLKQSQIASVRVRPASLPKLSEFDPQTAYLSFEIFFEHEVTPQEAQQAINDAFEFLSSELTITTLGSGSSAPQQEASEQSNNAQLAVSSDDRVESKSAETGVSQAKGSTSIRVDAGKLDDLVNLVGELVMKNGNLQQLAYVQQSKEFVKPISEMSRLVESVRELAMNLRMVPIGSTFRKMERLVRDIALSSGKQISISFSGEETELDKNIIEKINDPLIHIIRNAVDHGIETPEERKAVGKAIEGHLNLNAFHEAGTIVIEISDDGHGLNYDKILKKAIEKGLADPGRDYSNIEIQAFIFQPGFSTAGQLSELSGRGVGMDVVKKNIDSLRGNIRVTSEQGKGMTIRIALPLTLAIIDGFLIRSGKQKFVLPLDSIKECVDFDTAKEQKSAYDSQLFNLRGEVLPYLRLSEIFSLEKVENENGRESLIVVQQGDHRLGIVIDEPLGEYQTVIKPLIGFLTGIKGIGGATILGAGDMALILDVMGLRDIIENRTGSIK